MQPVVFFPVPAVAVAVSTVHSGKRVLVLAHAAARGLGPGGGGGGGDPALQARDLAQQVLLLAREVLDARALAAVEGLVDDLRLRGVVGVGTRRVVVV